MRCLLTLFFCVCCVMSPVVAQGGNVAPRLYLELSIYDFDPNNPGPAPPEICVHPMTPSLQIPCYFPKAAYNFATLSVHVARLDTPPLAQGWPPPCGLGGGYIGLSYGVVRTGTEATFVGFLACPGFLQGPGTAPAAIVVSATTACHDWMDHSGYCKYTATTNLAASYFNIVNNADEATVKVINCQANLDVGRVIAGGAQWGGTKTILCCCFDPVEVTTWSKIKGLFR